MYIPKEDALQEIRIAILISEKGEVFKKAHSLLDRLCGNYGFSRKKGKDNFQPFYTHIEHTEYEERVLNEIEELYIEKGYTAKEVCSFYGIKFNNKLAKIFCKCFPNKKKLKNEKSRF